MKIPLNSEYNEKYDCYFDPVSDTWLESKCVDPECPYKCYDRPEKPSQCEQNELV